MLFCTVSSRVMSMNELCYFNCLMSRNAGLSLLPRLSSVPAEDHTRCDPNFGTGLRSSGSRSCFWAPQSLRYKQHVLAAQLDWTHYSPRVRITGSVLLFKHPPQGALRDDDVLLFVCLFVCRVGRWGRRASNTADIRNVSSSVKNSPVMFTVVAGAYTLRP